ncbi:unnamed protein product [Ceutorhynchus assimilis]|uniref:Uncharacterized protein n=1 Tax=Ceutorhynchus assimilis TaxID=467358 RepID=A0A9N9MAI2_9CUCU|nr:unnamed protein product [Ceutorhynchus assimilis]
MRHLIFTIPSEQAETSLIELVDIEDNTYSILTTTENKTNNDNNFRECFQEEYDNNNYDTHNPVLNLHSVSLIEELLASSISVASTPKRSVLDDLHKYLHFL